MDKQALKEKAKAHTPGPIPSTAQLIRLSRPALWRRAQPRCP